MCGPVLANVLSGYSCPDIPGGGSALGRATILNAPWSPGPCRAQLTISRS